jgi:large subunit ribosomal protein L23
MPIFKKTSKKDNAPEAAAKPIKKSIKAAKAVETVAPAKATRAARSLSVMAARTIVGPVASEKSAALAARNVYAFYVAVDANRIAVKQAIRELYSVTPVKVNIMNVRGTARRFGRFTGRTNHLKKALVTLPLGSHIDVFEAV